MLQSHMKGLSRTPLNKSDSDTDAAAHSDIHLKANVYTKLSSSLEDDNFLEETKTDLASVKATQQQVLTYTVQYAGKQTVWTESTSTDVHKS